MKIGLVGFPGSGKSTVFGAITGLAVETGYAARGDRTNVGVVKVPDARIDALSKLYEPKKTTYAEVHFVDLGGGPGPGLDRTALNAMRPVDALCQVLRAFENEAGDAADPLHEIEDLETETLVADLEVIEQRVARLAKDRSDAAELELLRRVQAELEEGRALRAVSLDAAEHKRLGGYSLLSLKPLLLVLNVAEDALSKPVTEAIEAAAKARGLGLVVLSARVEMEIAQLPAEEQPEYLASVGLEEPASHRFIRGAYELVDLVSMLTVGPDECRAWPIPRGTPAQRAAGKIHSDIERGFIRAEVILWQELIERGSEARCRDAGVLRVEGKNYVVQDGDVVNFRFNV